MSRITQVEDVKESASARSQMIVETPKAETRKKRVTETKASTKDWHGTNALQVQRIREEMEDGSEQEGDFMSNCPLQN